MSLARYDLRKNGGRRQKTRLAPQLRLRPLTPGELQLAGWSVWALVTLLVAFVVDQPEVTRTVSGWIDSRPTNAAEKSTTGIGPH